MEAIGVFFAENIIAIASLAVACAVAITSILNSSLSIKHKIRETKENVFPEFIKYAMPILGELEAIERDVVSVILPKQVICYEASVYVRPKYSVYFFYAYFCIADANDSIADHCEAYSLLKSNPENKELNKRVEGIRRSQASYMGKAIITTRICMDIIKYELYMMERKLMFAHQVKKSIKKNIEVGNRGEIWEQYKHETFTISRDGDHI